MRHEEKTKHIWLMILAIQFCVKKEVDQEKGPMVMRILPQDYAVTTFAHGAKNAISLRTIGAKLVGVSLRVEQTYTSHISPTAINPKIVCLMGDFGEELNLKWFLLENFSKAP